MKSDNVVEAFRLGFFLSIRRGEEPLAVCFRGPRGDMISNRHKHLHVCLWPETLIHTHIDTGPTQTHYKLAGIFAVLYSTNWVPLACILYNVATVSVLMSRCLRTKSRICVSALAHSQGDRCSDEDLLSTSVQRNGCRITDQLIGLLIIQHQCQSYSGGRN